MRNNEIRLSALGFIYLLRKSHYWWTSQELRWDASNIIAELEILGMIVALTSVMHASVSIWSTFVHPCLRLHCMGIFRIGLPGFSWSPYAPTGIENLTWCGRAFRFAAFCSIFLLNFCRNSGFKGRSPSSTIGKSDSTLCVLWCL